MHRAFGQCAVGRRVELEKSRRLAERGCHLLQRVDAERRGDHRHADARRRPRRRPRRREVAMPVRRAQPDHADRAHEQRRRQPQAEQLDGKVAPARTHEHPRHQAPAIERADVGILGPLVAAPPGDVGHQAGRHRRMRLGLQRLEADRQARLVAGQPGTVDLVLIVSEMRHQRSCPGSLRSSWRRKPGQASAPTSWPVCRCITQVAPSRATWIAEWMVKPAGLILYASPSRRPAAQRAATHPIELALDIQRRQLVCVDDALRQGSSMVASFNPWIKVPQRDADAAP